MSAGEERFDLYAAVDRIWYEDISFTEIDSDFVSEIKSELPSAEMRRQGVWMHVAAGDNKMQDQGWKIHVSSTDGDAAEVLKIVCQVCEKYGTHFKFICDRKLLSMVNSKMWPRTASGKFIAIYSSDDVFHEMAAELDEKLVDFNGPHVLSDRRYGKSKCVFYRYGGFVSKTQVQSDGSHQYLIKDKAGNYIADERKPFFVLPKGVSDPVRKSRQAALLKARISIAPDKQDTLNSEIKTVANKVSVKLNNKVVIGKRFEIDKPLSFTSAGGVYTATDLETGNKVVLKEARTYVGRSEKVTDNAISLLENEYRLLDIVKHEKVTPAPLALCWDSGKRHRFLAEEFIEGMALGPLLIGRNPVFGVNVSDQDKHNYRNTIRDIFHKLAKALAALHKNDVCMGDLSLMNIIVNNWDEDISIRLIDLEGGWTIGDEPSKFYTPGFSLNPDNFKDRVRGKRDDIFSLGRVMLGAFIPATSLAALNEDIANKVFREAASRIGVSQDAFNFIYSLTDLDNNPDITVDKIVEYFSNPLILETGEPTTRPEIPFHNQYELLQEKISDFIIKAGDVRRKDRLFPSHYRVYSTNGLNLAHGAAGVIHSLHASGRQVPEKYISWLMTQPMKADVIPPGLFSGTAGIAAVMSELNKNDFAQSLITSSARHPLAIQDPFMYGGATGIGLATLWIYGKTRAKQLLHQAESLGESIASKVTYVDGQAHWHDKDGEVPLGLLEGVSGISLFMLYLFLATGKEKYRSLGEAALKTVIDNKVIPDGKDFWTFSSYAGHKKMLRNYWADGSAGVGILLLRWHLVTGNSNYLQYLENILPDIERPITIMPGLLMGMSGIGLFHLEAYKALGRKKSLESCKQLVEMISIYSYAHEDGVGIPGEQLQRLSTDFASGSSGALLLLSSLNATLEGRELDSFGIAPLPDFLLTEGIKAGTGNHVN